jgi:membrane protease YdiL (CAAX protease family)
VTEATFNATGKPVILDKRTDTLALAERWGSTFIGLAALGINSRRAYIISLLRIVFYPHVFLILAGLLAAWLAFPKQLSPVAMVILIFGYIIAGGVAVIQSVVRTHRRPWRSLISVQLTVDWRRLAIGAAVQAVLIGLLLVPADLLAGQPMRPLPAPPVLVLALLLTPLQAATEEIVFRGYLTQALGRIFRSRAKIIVAVGILFAMLHWNTYGPLTMPFMFLFSVLMSLVSLRDEGLELTIGAHTAVNWMGVGEIGVMVSGHAPAQVTWQHFPALAIGGIMFYALTRLGIRLLCGERRLAPLRRTAIQA